MQPTTGTRPGAHRPRRVLAATAALALGTGLGLAPVAGAFAAPGDESHASAAVVSGSLLAGLPAGTLALLGTSEASNDGTQPTQLEQNPLDASVLQALTVDLGGGIQVPLTLGDVGALQSYARAEADGTSVAAAGLVGTDGAIGAGAPGAGAPPAALTVDLSDVLGAAIASELTDVDLSLDTVSGSATSIAGGAPVGDYEILGGDLVLTSGALADTADLLDDAIADLEAALGELEGPGGDLATDIAALGDLLGVVGIGAGSTASVDVDLTGVLATLDLSARSVGPVTVDPTTGVITVDLDALNGGSLNGLGPNTDILTATQLASVVDAVDTVLDEIVADAEALIDPLLVAAIVDVDLDLTVDLGAGAVPLATVTVDGTLGELTTGAGVADVLDLGAVLDLGLLDDAGVAGVVDGLLDDLLDDVAGILDAAVIVEVLDGLDPALDGLADVLRLTVNNQTPSPPVAGAAFTETAFRLSLLPAGPAGTLLTLDLGQASVGPNVVDVAPTITAIAPTSGPETGGTTVSITGTGMVGSTGVLFDGIPGTGFAVVSDTELSVITPAHAPGPVDVVILHPSGPSLPGTFTYTPLISIADIDPNFGPEAGGTIVDIVGTCFLGATGVSFGGVPATAFTVNSDTSITATAPAGTGIVDVVVLGAPACGGATVAPGGFTYVQPGAPTITAITPDEGPEDGGTPVTISGTGFTGATGVTFGGVPATDVVVVDDSTITAETPAHAPGLVGVVVVMPGPDSGPVDFLYTPLISIDGVDPAFGSELGGTVVEITGTCFTGATGVTFDGATAAYVVNSDTSITATTPAGLPGLADVTVIGSAACDGPETLFGGFEYIDVDAPVITDIDPDYGPQSGGTDVTIEGSGFLGATGVTFDGIAGTAFTVVDDATITATTPLGDVGIAWVRIAHPDGMSAPLAFVFLPATTITGIAPATGDPAGGTRVTINGSCFTGATAVTFDGVDAASFTVLSDGVLSAVTPAGTGTVDVTVTGTVACGLYTLADGFAYVVGAGGGLADTGGASPWPGVIVVLSLVLVGGILVASRRRSAFE